MVRLRWDTFPSVPEWLTPARGCTALFCAYVLELVVVVVAPRARRLFAPRYARRHRMAGLVYLALLALGLADVAARQLSLFASSEVTRHVAMLDSAGRRVAFDVALGVAGTVLTLTAAFDFRVAHQERRVKNIASGALDADQTVTFEEMLEVRDPDSTFCTVTTSTAGLLRCCRSL